MNKVVIKCVRDPRPDSLARISRAAPELVFSL